MLNSNNLLFIVFQINMITKSIVKLAFQLGHLILHFLAPQLDISNFLFFVFFSLGQEFLENGKNIAVTTTVDLN
jgi:hypothetical protein